MKQGKRKGSGKKPQLGKAKLPYQKRLTLGFAKVEKDLSWLMGAFQELLAELGEEKVEKALPFRLGASGDLPPIEKGKGLLDRLWSTKCGGRGDRRCDAGNERGNQRSSA